MSVISRSDGAGGNTYVPRDRYSLMMSFCVVPCSDSHGDALLLGDHLVQRQQPHRRRVDGHRGVHLAQRDALEQRAHVPQVRRPAPRPCRPRRGPARRRGRTRSASAGRTRPTARSGPWPGCARYSALDSAAEQWPAYVRISQGLSRSAVSRSTAGKVCSALSSRRSPCRSCGPGRPRPPSAAAARAARTSVVRLVVDVARRVEHDVDAGQVQRSASGPIACPKPSRQAMSTSSARGHAVSTSRTASTARAAISRVVTKPATSRLTDDQVLPTVSANARAAAGSRRRSCSRAPARTAASSAPARRSACRPPTPGARWPRRSG